MSRTYEGCVSYLRERIEINARKQARKNKIAEIAARNAVLGGPKPYVQPTPFRGVSMREGLERAIAQVPTPPPAPKPTPPAPEPVPPTMVEEPVAVALAPKLRAEGSRQEGDGQPRVRGQRHVGQLTDASSTSKGRDVKTSRPFSYFPLVFYLIKSSNRG